jgi:replication initiation factor
MTDSATPEGEGRSNLGARKGPQVTSSSPEQEVPGHDDVLVDYLSATADRHEVLEPFIDTVGRQEVHLAGYENGRRDWRGATLAWGKRGARLCLPGSTLETLRGEKSDKTIFEPLLSNDIRVTRIDLARDTTCPLPPKSLVNAVKRGCYVSRFRKATLRTYGRILDTDATFYAGAPDARISLRVYDRVAKLASEGRDCPSKELTRYELVLRDDTANRVFGKMLRIPEVVDEPTGEVRWDLMGLFSRLLDSQLRVTRKRVDREHGHQWRSERSKRWEDFVRARHSVVLFSSSRQHTLRDRLARQARWFEQAALPTLGLISEVLGDRELKVLLERARRRARPEFLQALEEDPSYIREEILQSLGLDEGREPDALL